MKNRTISFSPPDISELEIAEVTDTLNSGWITTGPKTKKLEKKLAQLCQNERVVCLNSATAAEELNLHIWGIRPGDEVIVPAYTYSATASAVIHVGGTVVFVDSSPDSFEMDYSKVQSAITSKTKAIIAVDIAGIMCDYDTIRSIANSTSNLFYPTNTLQEAIGRIAIIGDCAHSLGATRNDIQAGNERVCDFASYSFHAVKNFTTAEGGAATWRSFPGIDSDELYHTYQLLSLHGQSKDALAKTALGSWEYDIVAPWYKCNMTDIMASIGLAQFKRYPSLLKRRHELIRRYDEAFEPLNIKHLCHYSSSHSSSGHLYLVRIPGISEKMRNQIIIQMAEKGITCNVHYKPLPMMTAYKNLGWNISDFPNAFNYYENLISLPLHTLLTDNDQSYIIKCFKKILNTF